MPVVRISEELFKEVQKYAEPLVDSFETALWKALGARKEGSIPMPHRTVTLPRRTITRRASNVTRQKEFWKPMLQSIVDHGGRARAEEVVRDVEKKMKDKLKPGDYEPNLDGAAKWIKAVHYQRLAMVHDGMLSRHSPYGVWEITDSGKQWLEKNPTSWLRHDSRGTDSK